MFVCWLNCNCVVLRFVGLLVIVNFIKYVVLVFVNLGLILILVNKLMFFVLSFNNFLFGEILVNNLILLFFVFVFNFLIML